MDNQLLEFTDAGASPSGLTRRWGVEGQGCIPLGTVAWFSHWRKYVFSPLANTVYDSGCLREIADFCAEQTREHNA